MAFEDVVELEHQAGDRGYTDWLLAGRPRLDPPTTVKFEQLEAAALTRAVELGRDNTR